MHESRDFTRILHSSALLRAIVQHCHLNAILIMDLKGIVLHINDSFTQTFAYTRDNIVGKNFAILFTEEDRMMGKPVTELQQVTTAGHADDQNFVVAETGQPIWTSGESVLVEDNDATYILKIIQDINRHKEVEERLEKLYDFNTSILKTIDDIVIVVDERLTILTANAAFYRLFRHRQPREALLDFGNFIKPYDPSGDLVASILQIIQTLKGFKNKELEISTDNGIKIFEINGRCMRLASGQAAALLVVHDITTQKETETEREDIIGFVAHELRNPLANIILSHEMMSYLVEEKNTEDMKDLLVRSKNNILRLNKMISELYDATKMSSGNFNLEITSFDVDEMIEEAIGTMQVLQPAYNIVVKNHVNAFVSGDRYRLIQVLTNYISNGIKYSNGQTDIFIHVSIDDRELTVAVQDHGLGISIDQLPQVFKRFYRTDKTRLLEGIGLGLYLCNRIIEAHKGRVWVLSDEGKGATFYFAIPINNIPT